MYLQCFASGNSLCITSIKIQRAKGMAGRFSNLVSQVPAPIEVLSDELQHILRGKVKYSEVH